MNEVRIVVTGQNRSGSAMTAVKKDLTAVKKELSDLERHAEKVEKAAARMNDELANGFNRARAEASLKRLQQSAVDGFAKIKASAADAFREVEEERVVKVKPEIDKARFESSLDNMKFDFGGTKFASALDFSKAAGAAVREGLSSAFTSASQTLPKLINPAGMTAVAAGAAALGTLAGGALAGGLTLGLGAGIAGIGVVAAAKSLEVRSAFSRLGRDIGNDLAEISTPFRRSLVGMIDQSRFEFARLKPILQDAFEDASPAVQSFGENLARAFGRFGTAIKPITNGFTAVLDDLGPRLPGLVERIAGAFSRLADSVAESPEALGDLVDTVSNFVVVMIDAVRLLNDGYSSVRKFFEGLAGVEKVKGHATASKEALDALAQSAQNGTGAAQALEDAFRAIGETAEGSAARVDAVRVALDKMNGNTPEYTDALASAAEAVSQLGDTFKTAEDRAKGLGSRLLDSSGAFDVTNEKGRELYDGVQQLQDAFINMAAAVASGQMSREQFISDSGRMRDELDDILRQGKLTEAQIAALHQRYGLTPDSLSTAIRLTGADAAEARLAWLARDRMAYIRTQVQAYGGYLGTGMNGTPIFHDRAHGGVVASFAHGGVVARAAAGGVRRSNVVVNDWGSQSHGEAIRLPQGSTVIPASMTRSMESRWGTDRGAGQAGVIQVNVVLDGTVLATKLVDPMKGVMRKRGGQPEVFG